MKYNDSRLEWYANKGVNEVILQYPNGTKKRLSINEANIIFPLGGINITPIY